MTTKSLPLYRQKLFTGGWRRCPFSFNQTGRFRGGARGIFEYQYEILVVIQGLRTAESDDINCSLITSFHFWNGKGARAQIDFARDIVPRACLFTTPFLRVVPSHITLVLKSWRPTSDLTFWCSIPIIFTHFHFKPTLVIAFSVFIHLHSSIQW